MQITEHPRGAQAELRLTGRIDATWAEHLSASIEEIVRYGAHRVVLNFAGVEYISSLGIRCLILQYKLLKSVKGSLEITNPSKFCRNILTTVGLSEILAGEDTKPASPAPPIVDKRTIGGGSYE